MLFKAIGRQITRADCVLEIKENRAREIEVSEL